MKWLSGLFSGVKGLLPSPWVLLAFLALMIGAYFFGRSTGIDTGKAETIQTCIKEKEGMQKDFDKKLDAKQLEINTLVNAENDRRKIQNDKIEELEKQSRMDADRIAELERTQGTERTKIITEYVTKNVSSNNCGLSLEAVTATNKMITVGEKK